MTPNDRLKIQSAINEHTKGKYANKQIVHLIKTIIGNVSSCCEKIYYHNKVRSLIRKNEKNRDAIFIWIPKSAGSSLMQALERHYGLKVTNTEAIKQIRPSKGIYSFGHISIRHLLESDLIPDTYYQSAFKFSIVRNPYSRIVSLYQYLKKTKHFDSNIYFKEFCVIASSDDYPRIGLYNHIGLSQLNTQTSWLYKDGICQADFVGKFETLNKSVTEIFLEIGLPEPKLNKLNASSERNYVDYHDEFTVELTRRIYREDFINFGYDFGL